MPLDFAVFDVDHAPSEAVSLNAAMHDALFKLSSKCSASSWECLNDYYRDATFAPHEIESLIEDMQRMQRHCGDPQLNDTLEQLISLAREAMCLNTSLVALAD